MWDLNWGGRSWENVLGGKEDGGRVECWVAWVLIKRTKRKGERKLEKQKAKNSNLCHPLSLSFSVWSTFRLFFDQMDDSSYLWVEAYINDYYMSLTLILQYYKL